LDNLKKGRQINIKKINKADLVVIGGGGIYYHWFLPYNIRVINKITQPIIIFGVGYIREIGSRKLTKEEKESIVVLNKKATLSSVRDYYSKKFLVQCGVPSSKIKIIGDPAIFLEEKKPASLKFNDKPKIGLNLNYSGWLGFGKYEKEILKSYKLVAKYFIDKYNAEIYYLQHHPDEARIRKRLQIPKMKIVNLPPKQQKYVYGQLDLIIGMMLHSAVLAFGAETPEINVGYDLRNKSFASFIGCPELIIQSHHLKPEALLKKAKNVYSKRQYYCQKFTRRKAAIWKKQLDFINKIKKV
jgi:polysaccharide pyruvyl transferase WcaK-like protein